MAIEDEVDDFWRDVLSSATTPSQAEAKWNAFVLDLKTRVERFPQHAQDEIFLRGAVRNAAHMATARESLDALRIKLGLPRANSRLVEVAAEAAVTATVGYGVAAFFRLFR